MGRVEFERVCFRAMNKFSNPVGNQLTPAQKPIGREQSLLTSVGAAITRRHFLFTGACGFGGVALSWLFANDAQSLGNTTASPYAAQAPKFPARAKRVIHICALGGVSHLDTFDFKPELEKRHGQDAGRSFDTFFGQPGKLLKSPFAFAKHGASGRWVSELLPH